MARRTKDGSGAVQQGEAGGLFAEIPRPPAREDRLWRSEDGRVWGIVHGELPNKSNSRRLVMIGKKDQPKRPLIIKEKVAIEYEERFERLVKVCGLSELKLDGQLWLEVMVYQAAMRRDLDIELLCDCLQRAGLIVNDRKIWDKHARRGIDAANPRVEFCLWSAAVSPMGLVSERKGEG